MKKQKPGSTPFCSFYIYGKDRIRVAVPSYYFITLTHCIHLYLLDIYTYPPYLSEATNQIISYF